MATGKTFAERRDLLQASFGTPVGYFKWESMKSTYYRVKYAKEQLEKIIIDEGLKDGEQMVISHGATLFIFTGDNFDEIYKPADGPTFFQNAQVRPYELQITKPSL